jgi:hypothetical protein
MGFALPNSHQSPLALDLVRHRAFGARTPECEFDCIW